MTTVEAPSAFNEILTRIARGETVQLTRDGQPVATVTPVARAHGRPDPVAMERLLGQLAVIRAEASPGPETMDELINEGRP